MSKYFYRIFTIIDLHFGAMQPCSSGLGMTLEASDFRSVRRLVAYSTMCILYIPVGNSCCRRSNDLRQLTPRSPSPTTSCNPPISYSVCATSVHDGAGCLEMKRSMTACLHFLSSMEYRLLILFSSDSGMFT